MTVIIIGRRRWLCRLAPFALSAGLALGLAGTAAADWPVYGHDLANSRSAGSDGPAAGEIPTLQRAWTFNSPNGDFTGTPVVAGGTLVAGTNLGSIFALDPVTGAVRWRRDVGQPINGTAAIDLNAPGGATVFVPVAEVGGPRLLALSLATGAVRWDRTLTTQQGLDVFGSPVFWGGLRLSPHHPGESATSLTNEVRCGDAEGSLCDGGCEGRDLGVAGGGGERGRDRPAARRAEADGE